MSISALHILKISKLEDTWQPYTSDKLTAGAQQLKIYRGLQAKMYDVISPFSIPWLNVQVSFISPPFFRDPKKNPNFCCPGHPFCGLSVDVDLYRSSFKAWVGKMPRLRDFYSCTHFLRGSGGLVHKINAAKRKTCDV